MMLTARSNTDTARLTGGPSMQYALDWTGVAYRAAYLIAVTIHPDLLYQITAGKVYLQLLSRNVLTCTAVLKLFATSLSK